MRIMRALLATALATTLSTAAAHAQGSKPATAPKRDTTHAAQTNTMSPAAHASATTTSPAAAPVKHWSKEQIEEAQKGLTKAGFYKGPANGTWTHATASAMRAYQRANKMPATGQLTDEELARLKAS